ncbi:MAG: cupin domain-containing protein [Solirubrobacterales bacterium]
MLTNPFTGQTIEFVTDGEELLVMESTYKPGGAPAPAHFHPDQEETFTVLSGAVETVIDGEPRTLREGDVLVIPAGTPHVFGGHATEPGTVRWETRPALRTREFFERMFAALEANANPDAPGAQEAIAAFDFADYEDVFRAA